MEGTIRLCMSSRLVHFKGFMVTTQIIYRHACALTYAIQIRQSSAPAHAALRLSLKIDTRSDTRMSLHIQPRTGLIGISPQASNGVRLLFKSWDWLTQEILWRCSGGTIVMVSNSWGWAAKCFPSQAMKNMAINWPPLPREFLPRLAN